MRRGKEKDIKEYITIRITQLEEDAYKCKIPHDRQWYICIFILLIDATTLLVVLLKTTATINMSI